MKGLSDKGQTVEPRSLPDLLAYLAGVSPQIASSCCHFTVASSLVCCLGASERGRDVRVQENHLCLLRKILPFLTIFETRSFVWLPQESTTMCENV